MRDVTDNRTGELDVEVKRGRGRPRKPDAMTNAERQAAYRARHRKSITVTKNTPASLAIEVAAELKAELEATRAELAEAHETIDELNDELIPLRVAKKRLEDEVAELNQQFVELVAQRDDALAMAEKGVTRNGNPVSFEDMLELLALFTKARTLSERLAIREDQDGVYYRAIVRTTAVSQAQMEQVAAAVGLGPKKIVTAKRVTKKAQDWPFPGDKY